VGVHVCMHVRVLVRKRAACKPWLICADADPMRGAQGAWQEATLVYTPSPVAQPAARTHASHTHIWKMPGRSMPGRGGRMACAPGARTRASKGALYSRPVGSSRAVMVRAWGRGWSTAIGLRPGTLGRLANKRQHSAAVGRKDRLASGCAAERLSRALCVPSGVQHAGAFCRHACFAQAAFGDATTRTPL
jgi:hypothetical protein